MRAYLFWRAKKLIEANAVKRIYSKEFSEWYEIKSGNRIFNVRLFYDKKEGKNAIFRYTCDCDFAGIKGIVNNSPCSHIIAVFTYKTVNYHPTS